MFIRSMQDIAVEQVLHIMLIGDVKQLHVDSWQASKATTLALGTGWPLMHSLALKSVSMHCLHSSHSCSSP